MSGVANNPANVPAAMTKVPVCAALGGLLTRAGQLLHGLFRWRIRSGAPALYEMAPLRVRHRLETVVRTELAVHVMQMVTQRLRGDAERARDLPWREPLGEGTEDTLLLLGER